MRKAFTAWKCTMSQIGVNLWYVLAALYQFLVYVNADYLLTDQITTFYPKICACRAEAGGIASNFANMLTSSRATSYRCFVDPDDENSAVIDCDTEQELLPYDVMSCLETINWFQCTDNGSITGTDGQAYISLRSDCETDDRDYFIWYFDENGPAGDGDGYLRDSANNFLEDWDFLEGYANDEIDLSSQEDFWNLDQFTFPSS